MQAFAEVGWDRGRLLALSVGMTVSVALVNGFVSAIARRVALYLGLTMAPLATRIEKPRSAGIDWISTTRLSISSRGAVALIARLP